MTETWRQLRELVRAWTGMTLAERCAGEALAALAEVAHGAGLAAPADALGRAAHPEGAALRQAIVERITNGSTWFLREPAGLRRLVAALEQHARATGLDEVRVWSAACSTGEEPYTLAMMLLEARLVPRILATDINGPALRAAAAASYAEDRLEAVPSEWRERWFVADGPRRARVRPEVTRCVSVALHNVALDECPPAGWTRFDAVVCRNLLIYFDAEDAVAMGRRLAGACRPGGHLLFGAVEEPLLRVFDQPGASPRRGTPSAAVGRAPTLRPGELDASAHLARGLEDKRAGRLRAAVESFRRARVLLDDTWLPAYELGICLDALGEQAEAREAYRHALAVALAGGLSGLGDPEVDLLARTVAEACRARLEGAA
jgi:chemotaxis protein methyltransferase CheR